MRIAALLVMTFLLSGCATLSMHYAPPIKSWETHLEGMRVEYKIVDRHKHSGTAVYAFGTCSITLSTSVTHLYKHLVLAAAHEVAHCLDGSQLGWSHNGFEDEGCELGDYFCAPAEGFAETWALAYIDKCGYARDPLGLIPPDERPCELPDPRTVTPSDIAVLSQRYGIR